MLSGLPGFGLDTTVQREPSQCSISVRDSFTLLDPLKPTAHASLGERATTALSTLPCGVGLGLWTKLKIAPD